VAASTGLCYLNTESGLASRVSSVVRKTHSSLRAAKLVEIRFRSQLGWEPSRSWYQKAPAWIKLLEYTSITNTGAKHVVHASYIVASLTDTETSGGALSLAKSALCDL
jgi:hypothetical protein